MKKKERTYLLYLNDMLSSMMRIKSFLEGMNQELFLKDLKTQDAVVRNFEIIGEAANQIPDKIKNKYPQLPWKEMYGLRNIASHHYFGIDYELIWKIVYEQLPQKCRWYEDNHS